MKRLDGKIAVITGGSDGIGLAIAHAFARSGSDVILIARDKEKLRKISLELSEFGVSAKIITADLANPENIGNVADQILSLSEGIDILVNNAGIGRFINFSETNVEEFDLQFNLNVRTPYFLTQKLLQPNVLFSYYENNFPASSLVQVKSLFAPELKIEVEAIVALTRL